MAWLGVAAAFVIGAVAGFVIALWVKRESMEARQANIDVVKEEMKTSFGDLSFETLTKLSGEFSRVATERLSTERDVNVRELEAKKKLIDEKLEYMNAQLKNVSELMVALEKDRERKYGELSNQLSSATEQTRALMETTNELNRALSSAGARGQWGERMAEDVLRVAGFLEGVNYTKQETVAGVGRPDYVFNLPRGLVLNMDVKFPLDNYLKHLKADSSRDSDEYRKQFLRDVKNRIKEVTGRDYINPEQNTVDCVLLFIPNERIYAFIQEYDSSIIDYGMENRVLLCSPITLIAILAVIRQSVENFTIAETSKEILSLFGKFKQQWGKFIEQMAKVGDRIAKSQEAYDALAGTRRRMLERPLAEMDNLRANSGLPIASDEQAGISVEEVDALTPDIVLEDEGDIDG